MKVKKSKFKMKRYLVFADDYCIRNYGWESLKGNVDTLEEAKGIIKDGDDGCYNHDEAWFQVIDTTTGEVIAANREPYKDESFVDFPLDDPEE